MPLFTTDTGELFVGMGEGEPLVKVGDSSSAPLPGVRGPRTVRGDFDDSTHYYYGVTSEPGVWRITRNLISDVTVSTYADRVLNPEVTSLSQAWPIRTSLVYSA